MIILLYIVIGLLAIGALIFTVWVLGTIVFAMFGDIIERKLKILEARRKWEE